LGEILQDTKTICYAWALIPNHFPFSEMKIGNENRGQANNALKMVLILSLF
jgi:hypothetical protein